MSNFKKQGHFLRRGAEINWGKSAFRHPFRPRLLLLSRKLACSAWGNPFRVRCTRFGGQPSRVRLHLPHPPRFLQPRDPDVPGLVGETALGERWRVLPLGVCFLTRMSHRPVVANVIWFERQELSRTWKIEYGELDFF